jgi:hypothetical protein
MYNKRKHEQHISSRFHKQTILTSCQEGRHKIWFSPPNLAPSCDVLSQTGTSNCIQPLKPSSQLTSCISYIRKQLCLSFTNLYYLLALNSNLPQWQSPKPDFKARSAPAWEAQLGPLHPAGRGHSKQSRFPQLYQ